MSCKTQGTFVRSFVRSSICPSPPGLRGQIQGLRGQISGLRGPGGADGWTDGRTDGRTNARTKVPLCSTGLRPLRGRCPASSHSNSQSCKAGQRVSLTTYCPWATCSLWSFPRGVHIYTVSIQPAVTTSVEESLAICFQSLNFGTCAQIIWELAI